MFDHLSSGKKISLLASAAVAYMMLTAFIASLTESPDNLEWASWLGYYCILGFVVMLFTNGIDFKSKRDLARVGTCGFALLSTIGMVSGVPIFAFIMMFFTLACAVGVVALDFVENQQVNIIYAIIAFAFLLLFIFWIILAFSPTMTVLLLAYDMPTILLAGAAGYNCYLIYTTEEEYYEEEYYEEQPAEEAE